MESKIAQQAREDLIAGTRSLTPEQRLQAFLRHCRLVMQLYRAGQRMRAEAGRSIP
jgi:hypothetical protein